MRFLSPNERATAATVARQRVRDRWGERKWELNKSKCKQNKIDSDDKNESKSIDRFKKFARLGTSPLASDAITSICATTRGKRASDALSKLIYHFKDANPDYANSAIALIFSISESTLRGILKRGIKSDREKNKIGSKICTRKTNQASDGHR